MKTSRWALTCIIAVALSNFGSTALVAADSNRSPVAADKSAAQDVSMLERWSGDYPVAELKRLPSEQQKSSPGFIGDSKTFAAVWQAFQPDEKTPSIDFNKNLAVFSRNLDFYNRTSIARVTLKDGVVDVLAIETMSAQPIDDKVAMGLAMISRKGVRFVRSREKLIPVSGH